MRRTSRALIALWCIWASGCEPSNQDIAVQTTQLLALGTVIDITVVDDAERLTNLMQELQDHVQGWGNDMYAYGDGELAHANVRFARGDCATVSPRLRIAIDDAQRFERRHPGLFSAGLADLTRIWGLHQPAGSDWQPPPNPMIRDSIVSPPRASNLHIKGDQACPTGPVALDLGGFAKGRIIDELLAMLERAGMGNAIVNVGGDLKVRGRRPDRRWHVAIRDPRGGALARVALGDGEAVSTSGNYERFRRFDGRHYGHILDPLSGMALSTIASVTVIGHDAAATDAAATALYVAASRAHPSDPELKTLAPVLDAENYVIIDIGGSVFVSAPLAKRVEFLRPPAVLIHHPSSQPDS